jgi:hypothetical protein
MSEAIFGLVGVLVGSVTTGMLQWLLARRAERIEGRAAIRLVMQDFFSAQALARPVRATGVWGIELDDFILEGWIEYRKRLASDLDPEMWKRVEGSALGIRHLAALRSSAKAQSRDFLPTERNDFERIGQWLDETLKEMGRLLQRLDGSKNES